MQAFAIEPGRPAPLGATVRDGGVNFALASEHASAVDLCLFDAQGMQEIARLRLPARDDGVFHGFVPGCAAGAVYGYRVHGPHRPDHGHRFNAHKLLLDPYAREIAGQFAWTEAHDDNAIDNAGEALKAVVIEDERAYTPQPVRPLADAKRVLYELHVKGFTKLNTEIPPDLRGTYAGLAHDATIRYLKQLGVTTLCLLPVHYALDEAPLAARGLRNYWGYNTLGFFAPTTRLAANPSQVRQEFRAMVNRLHAAGFEVILDVVFNHTAESDARGPILSWRGIDNSLYYQLDAQQPARYVNITGCGNALNVAHPRVMQLILDSLRYWVGVMGVDGFRFDLAAVLGETSRGFDLHAPLFQAIAQDPLLAHITLIAEPWHAGAHGYRLGQFPPRWLEWNDKFRDAARRFWLWGDVSRGEFARRLLASADVFHRVHRKPIASVNYLCAHDGFTLWDAVSYNHKHNEANGESNRDGRTGEIAFNHGVEGQTQADSVLQERKQKARVLLATTLLAQGTPMLRAGDEVLQTQRGNNNAYCQDNEISWIDWQTADQSMYAFAAQLIALRKRCALLMHDAWFHAAPSSDAASVQWFNPHGHALNAQDWEQPHAFAALFVPATQIQGVRIWLGFNPEASTVSFGLPDGAWQLAIDCAQATQERIIYQNNIALVARNFVVLLQENH